MKIHIDLGKESYDIVVGNGIFSSVEDFFKLDRKLCIVTDDGVPSAYVKAFADKCAEPYIYCIPQGEQSKTIDNFIKISKFMLDLGFSRFDAVVAVGGGVPGDLAGFCAASYMRGIDFYNIPTTLLASVDSSIGGKTAVDLAGYKNMIGAFKQPKAVFIDTAFLSSLSERQLRNGLFEAIKMGVNFDSELIELFEAPNLTSNLENIIIRSLKIKADVVEKDEKESGLRKALNFGHTLGHALESVFGLSNNSELRLLHGECVALGMLPMCTEQVRERLLKIYEKLGFSVKLPKLEPYRTALREAICHDKKGVGDEITVVKAEQIGEFRFEKLSVDETITLLLEYFE